MGNKILVVDDDAGIRKLLRRVFSRNGYEVLLTDDGAEALKAVEDDAIKLMILDIRMPRMDGLEVIRAVHEIRPKLPAIVVSGQMDAATVKKFMDAGVFDFVSKPFDIDYLETIVMTHFI